MNRCALCPGDHNCVPMDGPANSSILFLGEGPGWDEDKRGHPFCGKTGREVNEGYLPICGLQRPNVRFGNAMLCMPKGIKGKMDIKRAADRELATCCASTHLYPDIECNNYKLIVAMGVFANYVLDPTIDLELQHGIPVQTKWGPVFPMYHPAGGLHEPKKMLHIRTDWVRLRDYLRGKLVLPEDRYAGIEDYREITDVSSISGDLLGHEDLPLANDTESTRQRTPFCLTYSIKWGTGRLIRAERLDLLEEFQNHVNRWRGPILWHNWLYDSEVVTKMGMQYPHRLIVDTMVRSFHLGNIPQGLKALAYRELGMEMQDFDDLVTPFARPIVLAYYRAAYNEDWVKPEPFLYRDEEGKWKMKQPQSMTTKFKRFFSDYSKDPDKDIFSTWDNWEDSHKMIQERLGPFPGKCISYAWEADREATIRYACRDADSLLRLYPLLTRMRSQVRRKPQEAWRAA